MPEKLFWKTAIQCFWERIPENERLLFRIKVMKNCEISSTTFYRWRTGMNLPSSDQRKKINYIAKSMGYDRVFQPKKTQK